MKTPGKIHYGAPTTDGVWHPFCGAKPKGANCTPLVEYVECERCHKVIATCDVRVFPNDRDEPQERLATRE